MKSQAELLKVKRGTFVIKFDFEDLTTCLGSYDLIELDSGAERVRGHDSIERALIAGQEMYKDDPEGPAAFTVLNSFLKPVKRWTP